MRFGTTISGANGYDSEQIRRREGRGSQGFDSSII